MKTNYTIITCTCNCGSKIEIEHPDIKEAEEFLVRWRNTHLHVRPNQSVTGGYPYTATYSGGGISGVA
jgi:hypothetical protein